MARKLNIMFLLVTILLVLVGSARAETISFTAQDIINWMADQGAPLHTATDVWGITRVRAIPDVSVAGGYTINLNDSSITPDNFDWRVQFDITGNPPYGNGVGTGSYGTYAAFNDTHLYSWQGSLFTNGTVSVISDLSPAEFAARFPTSLTGSNPGLTLAQVPDDAVFSFSFTLDPGVTWNNQGFWFVVDGYWYNDWYPSGNTYDNPIGFTGGYAHDSVSTAGNLTGNMGGGYYATVPLPSSLVLLLTGLLGLAGWRMRKIIITSSS